MAKVLSFPGSAARESQEDEDPPKSIGDIFKSFMEDAEQFESALVITVMKDGRIAWGSASNDIQEVVWLSMAMQRIAMDSSLGIADCD